MSSLSNNYRHIVGGHEHLQQRRLEILQPVFPRRHKGQTLLVVEVCFFLKKETLLGPPEDKRIAKRHGEDFYAYWMKSLI